MFPLAAGACPLAAGALLSAVRGSARSADGVVGRSWSSGAGRGRARLQSLTRGDHTRKEHTSSVCKRARSVPLSCPGVSIDIAPQRPSRRATPARSSSSARPPPNSPSARGVLDADPSRRARRRRLRSSALGARLPSRGATRDEPAGASRSHRTARCACTRPVCPVPHLAARPARRRVRRRSPRVHEKRTASKATTCREQPCESDRLCATASVSQVESAHGRGSGRRPGRRASSWFEAAEPAGAPRARNPLDDFWQKPSSFARTCDAPNAIRKQSLLTNSRGRAQRSRRGSRRVSPRARTFYAVGSSSVMRTSKPIDTRRWSACDGTRPIMS